MKRLLLVVLLLLTSICEKAHSEEAWNTFVSLKELAQLSTLHDLTSNFLALIQGFNWNEFDLLGDCA